MISDIKENEVTTKDGTGTRTKNSNGIRRSLIINPEYPKEIVEQLNNFGYKDREIIMAMESVDDKKDINKIMDIIEKEHENSQNEDIKHEFEDNDDSSESLLNGDTMTAGFRQVLYHDITQFYMIDMEGLSHNASGFTKKLFYACYAMSNVIVWNDKQIGSDGFRKFMQDLKTEMKFISKSQRKPCLLYLQRDADDSIDFGKKFQTLDGYLKGHESFQWLRDMNIFSSVHGFQLPARPKKSGFDREMILKLVEFTQNLTLLSKRY